MKETTTHSLKKYSISNFKAFSGQASIPVRPITLIYGPNSSGKSSIFQTLLMLKQTMENSDSLDSALSPKGKLVDLGNYGEFIHGHDEKRSFSVVAHFSYPDDAKDILPSDEHFYEIHEYSSFFDRINRDFPYETLGIGINFTLDNKKIISANSIDLYLGDEPLPILSYSKKNSYGISEINYKHPYWKSYYNSLMSNPATSNTQSGFIRTASQ